MRGFDRFYTKEHVEVWSEIIFTYSITPWANKCKLVKAAIIDFWSLHGRRQQRRRNKRSSWRNLIFWICLNHKRNVVRLPRDNLLQKGGEIANTAGLHMWILVGLVSINLKKAHVVVSGGIGLRSQINYSSYNELLIEAAVCLNFDHWPFGKEIWGLLCLNQLHCNSFHMHGNVLNLLPKIRICLTLFYEFLLLFTHVEGWINDCWKVWTFEIHICSRMNLYQHPPLVSRLSRFLVFLHFLLPPHLGPPLRLRM